MEFVKLYQQTKKTYDELKVQHDEMLMTTKKLTEEFHQRYEPHGDIKETYQQTYDGWKKASDEVERLLGPLQHQLDELHRNIKEIYGIEL